MLPMTEPKETEEIIVPAFHILNNHNLKEAEKDLKDTYDLLKDGMNEKAVLSANNALENVVERTLDKRHIEYNKKDSLNCKLDNLIKKTLMPEYTKSSLNSLISVMMLPETVRNNNGGHALAKGTVVHDYMVEYEIDLVCSTILFIVRSIYE